MTWVLVRSDKGGGVLKYSVILLCGSSYMDIARYEPGCCSRVTKCYAIDWLWCGFVTLFASFSIFR